MLRICLVPVFVVALLSPWPEWMRISGLVPDSFKSLIATILFIVISCTDWIDGYLARSRGEVTNFGKFVDPLADKILVLAALLALVELGVLPSWPVMIILAREFIVSGVRMVAASEGVVIAASWYGKIKTVLQICAIVLFLVKDSVLFVDASASAHHFIYIFAWAVMLAALVFTIVSMMDYLAKGWQIMRSSGSRGAAEGKTDAAGDLATGEKYSDSESLMPEPMATVCGDAEDAEIADLQALRTACETLAAEVVAKAARANVKLACAESLTGGLTASFITSVPGSSAVFNGAIVSYVNEIKHARLGVDESILQTQGAVSAPCASQMARGAAAALNADVAVSLTGIAGPGGEEPGKPVGTVYMGVFAAGVAKTVRFEFAGGREAVRLQSAGAALDALRSVIPD
jgi:CDP-diacylglycerol--glycerol-3-phosphate 3-phosphatidyltransferase